MEFTLKQLQVASKALEKIINKPMDVKLAYRLAKLSRKITPELEDLEKVRMELIKKLGVEDEHKQVKVPDEKHEEFFNEITKVLEEKVTLDVELIPMDLFEQLKEVTPMDVMQLEIFLEEKKIV